MTVPYDEILTVTLRREPGCTHVVVAGELDIATAGRIEREVRVLLAGGCAAVAIDLRELEFIDSSGVHELLRCRDHALTRGARLHVLVAPGPVSRALDMCGVRGVLDGGSPAAA